MKDEQIALEQYKKQIQNLPLKDFAPDSPVWIYMSSRALNPKEVIAANKLVGSFVENWVSHGTDLEAYGELLFSRLLLLSANSATFPPSGCSIDASVHFVKKMEEEFSVDFFDRMWLAFIDAEGEIDAVKVHTIPSLIGTGTISKESAVFDNTIHRIDQLLADWIKPLEKSWVKRFID